MFGQWCRRHHGYPVSELIVSNRYASLITIAYVNRTDGKNLKKMLSEQKQRFERESRAVNDALVKALDHRAHCQKIMREQKENLSRYESFEGIHNHIPSPYRLHHHHHSPPSVSSACPDQQTLLKHCASYQSSRANWLKAEEKWIQCERNVEATRAKHDVCMAHFMALLQKANHTRTNDVKQVLRRFQSQLKK